ncbi:Zinc-finger homeodomain protein 1 [Sesamum angolense]|uniref:Zinc-finger homeodomain protein 1 n=1 Tax=Sesamum angolense TaxID=2727404 RepID=A0AAE1WIH1_9LAMI|nr:Zinc-finger homeodomain protein 1 [Sesamum angolense]
MEYEDQEEEQEGEVGLGPSYDDSLGNSNSGRDPNKMPSPVEGAPPPLRKPRYKECLKNHAVGMGGHAVDGCGEFLPAGEEGTLESLRCAACNCHRNFHRRENEGGGGGFVFHQRPHQQQLLLAHHPHGHFGYRSPSGYLHVAPPQQQQRAAPLALPSSSGGGGGGAGSGSRDEMEGYYSNPSSSGGKKRFRTKFTQEQKDKMLNLAERLEWKIQKQDEELLQQFCSEVGVKRHVLKVWMHNNKHTLENLKLSAEPSVCYSVCVCVCVLLVHYRNLCSSGESILWTELSNFPTSLLHHTPPAPSFNVDRQKSSPSSLSLSLSFRFRDDVHGSQHCMGSALLLSPALSTVPGSKPSNAKVHLHLTSAFKKRV